MRSLRRLIWVGAAGLLTAVQAQAAEVTLFEYAFNIDGTLTNGSAPSGASVPASFGGATPTGLGTVSVSVTSVGNHKVLFYVDHEIDESANTFFNEFGSFSGILAAGQSWEIDEPGFVFGDIYTNFSNTGLDKTNSVPASKPDDVAMAMGWNFSLAAGQIATISFILSDVQPVSGFYLTQTDPASNYSLYFSSNLNIRDQGQAPEPAGWALTGLALLGAWQARRRVSRS